MAVDWTQQYGTFYETVPVAFRVDPATGRFQGAVMVPSEDTDFVWAPVGRVFEAVGSDRESAVSVFARVDAYVRLLLPEGFLARFDVPFPDGSVYGVYGAFPDSVEAAGEPVTFEGMYDFVGSFFGARLGLQHWVRYGDVFGVRGVLYDAFVVWVGLDVGAPRPGSVRRTVEEADFFVRFEPGPFRGPMMEFFGEGSPRRNGRRAIAYTLGQIDRFARESLPVKYVEAFERAHGVSGTAGGGV